MIQIFFASIEVRRGMYLVQSGHWYYKHFGMDKPNFEMTNWPFLKLEIVLFILNRSGPEHVQFKTSNNFSVSTI